MLAINLIPEQLQLAQEKRIRIQRWSATLALALLILALPIGIEWYRGTALQSLRNSHQAVSAHLAQRRTELKKITQEAAALQSQIDRAKTLRAKRSWSALLAMFARSMPEELWLTDLATDPASPGAAAPTAPTAPASPPDPKADKAPATISIEAPRKLRLSGFAADHVNLYAFMENLKASGAFSEVLLLASGVQHGASPPAVFFELSCAW